MHMDKSRVFLVCVVAFIVGVGLRSVFAFNGMIVFLLLSIFFIIALSVFWKNKLAIVMAGAIIFFGLGILRIDEVLNKISNIEEMKNFSGSALVIREPETRDFYQNIIARTNDGTMFMMRVPLHQDVRYGDELNVACTLSIPKNTQEDFDYRMYLAARHINYLCDKPEFSIIARAKGNAGYAVLLETKDNMEENINRVIPEPQAALATGLIIGGSEGMTKNVQEYFSKTGMTHIVAVSGYNVTIVAEYLMMLGIFLGLWRKQAFWFAVCGIFAFVLVVGFPASAVRAGVMGTLLLWAMKNGRLANAWNAIFLSAAIMLVINPLLLIWDIGFQLSFLATIGIVAFSPLWEKYFLKQHKAFGFSEIVLLSLSAQVFVLPIMIYHFQKLSLISLAANVLVLPIVPLSMLLVFITAIAGFIFAPLSLVFSWLANAVLFYEIWVVKTLADISWAQGTIERISSWWMLGIYAILGIIVFAINRKFSRVCITEEESISF